MDASSLLVETYSRLQPLVNAALSGLDVPELEHRPSQDANSIGWLVWHLTRVQDDHVADLMGTEQLWVAQGWHERFGLDLNIGDTGYGHSAEQVGKVQGLTGELLTSYFGEVINRTMTYLKAVTAAELDRVVDTSWDPPVTMGVRLVSVADDSLQHLGQAAYVRGLLLNPNQEQERPRQDSNLQPTD